jgi:hypothetical protein
VQRGDIVAAYTVEATASCQQTRLSTRSVGNDASRDRPPSFRQAPLLAISSRKIRRDRVDRDKRRELDQGHVEVPPGVARSGPRPPQPAADQADGSLRARRAGGWWCDGGWVGNATWFNEPLMTGSVMVFGRRRITKDAERSGPAYENRQRTKPREKVRTAVPRSAYQHAPEAGFLYNLSVMA